MLADDLVGAVALDALRAKVPRDDAAARVEHEDRVVPHALDEEPECLLARAQSLVRRRWRRMGWIVHAWSCRCPVATARQASYRHAAPIPAASTAIAVHPQSQVPYFGNPGPSLFRALG